jgi:cytochrome c oxidase cbb3-type subunit III
LSQLKPGCLIGGLLLAVCFSVRAQQEPATKNPPPQPADQSAAAKEAVRNFLAIGAPPDADAVKRGQALFVPTCGFCHGSNAHGGATGPDLVRSVLVLHDQGSAKEIGPVIRNGRPAKGMPAFTLTDAQIKDLAAFLLSRNQAAANRMEYKILNVVTGDQKAGESYFSAHCASCHAATGDLAHIAGTMDAVALQSRFLYPRPREMDGAIDSRAQTTVTVTLASGQTYSGKLVRIDDFSVSLTDQGGQHHSWLLESEPGINVQVVNPLQAHIDLLKQYSDADMHNMLAYLETLK